ncbi:hypothetical protein [Desulfoluna sp.]|uniref:hypothetical protein n=1 Tax=Desulfoluna sp. TaxID=2045199 RepID=UPI00260BD92F|nr:hypothetical protein [Desulfoluna sp.]
MTYKYLFRMIPVITLIFFITACGGSNSTDPTATPEGPNASTWDPMKKLTTIFEKSPGSEELVTYASYTYDEDSGLLECIIKHAAEEDDQRFIYDDTGRIIRMDEGTDGQWDGGSTTISYDDSGRPNRLDGGQFGAVMEYDENGRLIKINRSDLGVGLEEIETWAYDASGKPTRVQVASADDPEHPSRIWTYTYTEAGDFYQTDSGTQTFTYEWESDSVLKRTMTLKGQTPRVSVFTFSQPDPAGWEGQAWGETVLRPNYLMALDSALHRSKVDPCGLLRGRCTRIESPFMYEAFDFDEEGYLLEAKKYAKGQDGNPDSLFSTFIYEWK